MLIFDFVMKRDVFFCHGEIIDVKRNFLDLVSWEAFFLNAVIYLNVLKIFL